MGLKSGKYSENLKTFKDIIKNWNGSTCNCVRADLNYFCLKVLLTSPVPVNILRITYTILMQKNFVFNETVIIKIYYFSYIKCFHWVHFSYNVSLGLICIFIFITIIFIFCQSRLVSPRSYIVTLIP